MANWKAARQPDTMCSMDSFFDYPVQYVDVGEVTLRVRTAGTGSPVVLLHGHPRTHTTWYRVAPRLAERHTVVCPDLRGYGGSTAPATRGDHAQASKRAMARDVVSLMRQLGHERFAVVGHDRGSYVAQRMALDHPEVVTHLCNLDSVPIGEALARADADFAQRWWHWFFLGQTAKPAEKLINADPDAWYRLDPAEMGSENYADVHAAIHDPAVIHSMCEDYRAGLGVDRAADDADRADARRISCPVLALWAARDDMVDLYGDPVAAWSHWAVDVTGHAVDSGHHIAEEAPDQLLSALDRFLPR
jgi:haloacetate dehalogenase